MYNILIKWVLLFLIYGTVSSSTEHEKDSCSFQLCCSLIDQTVSLSTREGTVVANATTKMNKIQKHFLNVMLVGMASQISKNYTYKCVDRSRHNGIKGAKAKCVY